MSPNLLEKYMRCVIEMEGSPRIPFWDPEDLDLFDRLGITAEDHAELMAIAERIKSGDSITAAVAAERERCLGHAREVADHIHSSPPEGTAALDAQACLTYSLGYTIAADRIVERIKSGK